MAAVSAVAPAQTPESAPNPTLEAGCGLKVMLVLDESQSIHSFDAVDTVRQAATTFVDALDGTGSPLAITAFHSVARQGVPIPPGYQEVYPGNITTFKNWINNVGGGGYNPLTMVTGGFGSNPINGTTNWEDAFAQVGRTPGGPPDLVVFVTDGDPNTVNDPNAPGGRRFISNDEAGFQQAVGPAVTAANAVKLRSRIFGIGVGPDVTGPGHATSAERLRRVTGPRQGTNPITDDYTLVREFGDLRATLARIVARLCGSTLTITKYVDNKDGAGWTPTGGWDFTTTVDPTPGHTWLEPPAGGARSATVTTAHEGEHVGRAAFHWRLHRPYHVATLGVTKETPKEGFRFVMAQCEIHRRDGTVIRLEPNYTEIPGARLGREDYHTCQVYNVRRVAHLTVIKRLVPHNDPGRFDLLINGAPPSPESTNVGNAGTTGRVTVGLGRHTVSEAAAPGTNLTGYSIRTVCVNTVNGHKVASGVGTPEEPVSLDLTREEDDVVCTITNTNPAHGTLTVIKHVLPPGDPGRFNLLITQNGAPVDRIDDVGDGGRLGPVRLAFGSYEVSEEGAGQTVLADYLSRITCRNETTGHVVRFDGPSAPVTLNGANIQCTIINEHLPSTPPLPGVALLRVDLHVIPSDDPGLFDLRIDHHIFADAVGDGGSTARVSFEPNTTHDVSLSVDASQHGVISLSDYSIRTRCRGPFSPNAGAGTGPEPVSARLGGGGDNVVCSILLTRAKLPPGAGPGEGGAETKPGGGGEVANAPRLFVSKRMPAHARVGDRVPITITVKNAGHETAHGVRVHETPPHGGQLVAAANHGSLQHDGTVVWKLGNLSPGEERTVHATLLVTRTGLHLDTAVASASNADPAFDVAHMPARAAAHRPRPAHRPPPAVTG